MPSNAFLIPAAMMPNAKLTIVFLLLRSSLSQMGTSPLANHT
jgi:hypothetical protein